MTQEQTPAKTEQLQYDEVSPDALMRDFRGRSIIGLLAFTVLIHAVIVGAIGFGYFKEKVEEVFLANDASAVSEEEQLNLAVEELTTALNEIADRHDLTPRELSARLAEGGTKSPATTTAKPEEPAGENPPDADAPATDPVATHPGPSEPSVTDTTSESETPGSTIEETLGTTEAGPELPDLPPALPPEDDDLF